MVKIILVGVSLLFPTLGLCQSNGNCNEAKTYATRCCSKNPESCMDMDDQSNLIKLLQGKPISGIFSGGVTESGLASQIAFYLGKSMTVCSDAMNDCKNSCYGRPGFDDSRDCHNRVNLDGYRKLKSEMAEKMKEAQGASASSGAASVSECNDGETKYVKGVGPFNQLCKCYQGNWICTR